MDNTAIFKKKRTIKEREESKMVLIFLAWTMMSSGPLKERIPKEECDSERQCAQLLIHEVLSVQNL